MEHLTESRVCYDGVHTRVLSVAAGGPPIVLLPGHGDSADTASLIETGLGETSAHRRHVAIRRTSTGKAAYSGPSYSAVVGREFAVIDD